MNLLTRIALLLVVVGPALVKAQSEEAPVPPAKLSTPPPLISAPPEPPSEPQEPAPPSSQEKPLSLQWKSPRPNYFVPRILTGTVLGTLAGAGGLVGGFLLGLGLAPSCDPFDDVCSGHEIFLQTSPALLATGFLSSLVVYGMGSALHGEGDVITTLLGAFAGAAAGAMLTVAVANYGAILSIPPLAAVGAVIAYEISDSSWEREQAKARLGSSRLQWTPVVAVTPGGGVLGGLMGRF
ncbi:MAG TPA: hypothetical protein VNA24_06540 [Hyalangium sp.]|nr:hypothetical protein [Hyalangium sp.]